jgi:hypothetical protein
MAAHPLVAAEIAAQLAEDAAIRAEEFEWSDWWSARRAANEAWSYLDELRKAEARQGRAAGA